MALLFNRPGAFFSLPLIIFDWYYKYTPSFPITEKFLQPSSSGTSITAGQNNTLSDRSGTVTFTQSESGKQVSVSLNQSKGVEGWNYTFEVSPASLSFDAAGGTKQVSVTSYRCQTVNGIENGVQENVGYSSSVSGEGFSSNGTAVIAGENLTTNARNGNVTFIQDNSGKSVSVSLSQVATPLTTVTLKYTDSNLYEFEAYINNGDGSYYEIGEPIGYTFTSAEEYGYIFTAVNNDVDTSIGVSFSKKISRYEIIAISGNGTNKSIYLQKGTDEDYLYIYFSSSDMDSQEAYILYVYFEDNYLPIIIKTYIK